MVLKVSTEKKTGATPEKPTDSLLDFTKGVSQMLAIEGVRLGFHLVILVVTLGFQAAQPQFLNADVLIPIFCLMSAAFLLNAAYLVRLERSLKYWPATASLFFFESIFITFLIYYTGVNQSIFLFLYLVNIILCGFVFQRRGAFLLALWTSVLFSALLILGPDVKGQTLYLAVGLNNLAFFAVAMLSGYLSEQLNFMGTALNRQGRDIRALRNLNALILDNIATGLITVDERGVILQCNRASLEILDLGSSPAVGRSLDEIVPGFLENARRISLQTNEDAQTAARFDVNYKISEGEKLTLEVLVSVLPSEGAINGYIFTFQDLTRIRRFESQMRQSEKMAAVGQLAAGIAHEIRNPLASISGSIQLLGGSFTGRQEEEQKLMAIMLREIDRLNNLITEFLDFVRPDTLLDDPVDLNGLLREVLEMAKLSKGLKVETRQNLDLRATTEIGGHRDKLKQAFLNIIINGYQAMNDVENPQIFVSTETVQDKVVVRIRDVGCGIDERGLKKIFEPFHTTKPKGTGLGLAVTHKIIESHGGKIFVESQRRAPVVAGEPVGPSGTEFILEFPARAQRGLDKNALADSKLASENFAIAFRGTKRSS
jgi:two-component system sensor histidine kinase PilS (NtrC family)